MKQDPGDDHKRFRFSNQAPSPLWPQDLNAHTIHLKHQITTPFTFLLSF